MKSPTSTKPLGLQSFQTTSVKNRPLALSNDGHLSLFFVGVGSAFSKRHYQTNLLIIKGQDHLMVDCGTKTPQAFFELGLPIANVTNYFISHSHADHIGGLEEVMLVARYGTNSRPNIYITEGYQHLLWDLSLRGGSAFNEESNGRYLGFGDMWTVHRPRWLPNFPRESYEFDVGGINIKTFRTMHTPGNSTNWQDSFWSTGIIIDNRILFTGDTKFDRALLDDFPKLFDLETIFHDAQFFPPGGVHASIDELKTLPAELKSKMMLMHYGDDWEKNIEKVEASGFQGLARQWTYYDFAAPNKISGKE